MVGIELTCSRLKSYCARDSRYPAWRSARSRAGESHVSRSTKRAAEPRKALDSTRARTPAARELRIASTEVPAIWCWTPNIVLDWLVARRSVRRWRQSGAVEAAARWLATPAMRDELEHVLSQRTRVLHRWRDVVCACWALGSRACRAPAPPPLLRAPIRTTRNSSTWHADAATSEGWPPRPGGR